MKKNDGLVKVRAKIVLFALGCFFSGAVFSAPTPGADAARSLLPASAEPGVVSGTLAAPLSVAPSTLPPEAKHQEKAANTLGPQAAVLKFKLRSIVLDGNTVYPTAKIVALYQDKIGKTITVAELQDIVQSITNYYRNNGYILSRAVLPPQHVKDGIVHVQVLEGYVDKIKVIGTPKSSTYLLNAYGKRIAHSRPLQIKVMEKYLLLANEVPGVQTKAVLEPSKSQVAASDLNLVTQFKRFNAYVSYDNYGTRYIGPLEWTAGIEGDSLFRSGDSTQLNFSTVTKLDELKFAGVTHSTPLGTSGLRGVLAANTARTAPGFVLIPLLIRGVSNTVSATLQYPVLRSRSNSLTIDAGLTYLDSKVTTFIPPVLLYNDHLRTFKFGGNYYASDRWFGSNSVDLHVETGLPIWGATPQSAALSGLVSRVGGSGHFTRISFQLSRLQQFGATRYSLFAIMKGQHSFDPLLASEQFDFGGAQTALGRGYDSAEIIGDRGLAGSLEMRMNLSPDKTLLKTMQLYAFYDAGVIFNRKNVANQNSKQSATSVGIGSRFFFTQHVTGNFMIAQPLTKQISALQLINAGRRPRAQFSITATI